MKITLVGSRYFGRAVLDLLLKEPGIEVARVAVPAADDRLAEGARAAGLDVFVHENPHIVPIEAIAPGTDLIVTAHSHARVAHDAVAAARLGGIGYHPSLLPRHRGMAAVEWTVKEGDPIAGGTIYHLADKLDAGPIAAQDWVFVKKGEGARELWERALAPLGLRLILDVVRACPRRGRAAGDAAGRRIRDARPATWLRENDAARLLSREWKAALRCGGARRHRRSHAHIGEDFPTLRALIEGDGLARAMDVVADHRPDLALSDVMFVSPIPDPQKFWCIGVNYKDRNAEYKDASDLPKYPVCSCVRRHPSSDTISRSCGRAFRTSSITKAKSSS